MKMVVTRRLKDHDKWKNSKWSQGESQGSHDADDVMPTCYRGDSGGTGYQAGAAGYRTIQVSINWSS